MTLTCILILIASHLYVSRFKQWNCWMARLCQILCKFWNFCGIVLNTETIQYLLRRLKCILPDYMVKIASICQKITQKIPQKKNNTKDSHFLHNRAIQKWYLSLLCIHWRWRYCAVARYIKQTPSSMFVGTQQNGRTLYANVCRFRIANVSVRWYW